MFLNKKKNSYAVWSGLAFLLSDMNIFRRHSNWHVTSSATFDAYAPSYDILKEAVYVSTAPMLWKSD